MELHIYTTVVFVYKFEAFMLPILLNFIDLELKKILSYIAQAVQKSVTMSIFSVLGVCNCLTDMFYHLKGIEQLQC